MTENYAIYNKKGDLIYKSSFILPDAKKSTSFNLKGYKIQIESDNEFLESYFIKKEIEKILSNKEFDDFKKLTHLTQQCISKIEKQSLLPAKIQETAQKILQSNEILIDIQESLHAIWKNNELYIASIVGKVFFKKGYSDNLNICIEKKKHIEDISESTSDLDLLHVKSSQKTFLTYSRKFGTFECPIKIAYNDKMKKIYIENTSKNVIKNVKVVYPLKKHTYKTETSVEGAKSSVHILKNKLIWKISEIGIDENNRKAELQIHEYEIPNDYNFERCIKVSFKVDFWSDAAVQVKNVNVEGTKIENVFVSTYLKSMECEVRI